MTANSVSAVAPAPLPFRLRTALGVLLVGIAAAVCVPRAKAALRLNSLVSKYADYGLCMAGPTGAVAIAEEPARFRSLVRRRLVAAGPKEAPFSRCGKLSVELSGQSALEEVHRAEASSYLEWGGGTANRNLNQLFNDLPNLEALASKSYPFIRKPLKELILPTPGASDAIHPSDPLVPTKVHGLRVAGSVIRASLETARGRILMLSNGQDPWALRTRDQGRTWTATSAWQPAVDGYANRCVTGLGGTRYSVAASQSGNRAALLVEDGLLGAPTRRELGAPGEQIAVLSCDETGAAVLTRNRNHLLSHVYACPVASAGCSEITLPPLARRTDVTVDVARIARTTVIAVAKDGLLRVTTTRDDGVTMTPLSLVLDPKDAGTTPLADGFVATLLPLGKRLLLHVTPASAKVNNSDGYALVSEDFGASFRSL